MANVQSWGGIKTRESRHRRETECTIPRCLHRLETHHVCLLRLYHKTITASKRVKSDGPAIRTQGIKRSWPVSKSESCKLSLMYPYPNQTV